MKNVVWYVAGIIGMVFASSFLGISVRQMMAVAGFSSIFFGAIFFWQHRLAFALLGISFLLATGLIDVPHIIEYAGIDIILFLIGMMIIVGFLEERKFFDKMVNKLMLLVDMNGKRLMILILAVSWLSAALVDEVTSILFMAGAMFAITSRYKLNPIPFIIMVVFATNIGSSATVIGNPIGIIIAMRSGLGFMDFIRWAMPISFIVFILNTVLCFIYFAKPIAQLHDAVALHKKEREAFEHDLKKESEIKSSAIVPGLLFTGVILSLVFHAQVEHILGLQKNSMLLGTALAGAGISLVLCWQRCRHLVEHRVDWWTLCFFLFLFASVGALKYHGITDAIASSISKNVGNNVPLLMTVFVWSSGLLTSVMDNVLAVATFVPILKDIGAMGIPTFPLWWSILFGSTILGNLTIIGSTANIVAIGMMEKGDLGKVGFLEWLKAGAIIAIPCLLLAHILLLVQLRWMIR